VHLRLRSAAIQFLRSQASGGTVSLAQSSVASMVATASTVYEAQMNVQLQVSDLIIMQIRLS
jgi:hypothetical protein